MPTVPELVARWRDKQLTGTALMRALVTHPTWTLPISESAAAESLATNAVSRLQYNRTPEGVNRLMIFSNPETYSTYRTNSGSTGEQHLVTTTGTWIFRLPLDAIDQLWIDPLTANDIFYDKAQFDRLRRMADAVEVEEMLAGLRHGNAPEGAIGIVKKYQNFWIPVGIHETGMRLVMAPDDKGRSLAAVFTAEDLIDAFIGLARAHEHGTVEERVMSGENLFSILNTMPIDGMVFNCNVPVTPVAFAKGFAQIVCDA